MSMSEKRIKNYTSDPEAQDRLREYAAKRYFTPDLSEVEKELGIPSPTICIECNQRAVSKRDGGGAKGLCTSCSFQDGYK